MSISSLITIYKLLAIFDILRSKALMICQVVINILKKNKIENIFPSTQGLYKKKSEIYLASPANMPILARVITLTAILSQQEHLFCRFRQQLRHSFSTNLGLRLHYFIWQ